MAAQEHEQQAKTSATSSLPTSSERSSSSAPSNNREGGAESDEEIRRVPEIGSGASASSGAGGDERGKPGLQQVLAQGQQPAAGKKRGRAAGDKEQNRLKRLLRNRVSAQQARERKKAYLTELEAKAKDLEHRNAELEQRVSTLQNENNTLRQILKNTTAHAGKRGGGGGGAKGGDGGKKHHFTKS
ncbi:hypothetical protein PR202_gb26273 [Eleusine coracana subsp. coracana]|uniref:Transcription factor HY5 n=1 Tax=Eleusine coracana subsp. coracana TaxID=191504 RepID=A0AAV5FNI3_ELECO|nr:hypothetical protein QOZ80_1BG0060170 [Eleusine coracana subsp. coracana]GJN37333.1 hypothetical protein PR202_gb26273 [Eleusine coracana subsp. coracana]